MKKSLFSLGLVGLLDETLVFSRKEWAYLLGETEGTISEWVKNRSIPRSDQLSMIVDALKTTSGVPTEVITSFEKMAELPARQVSPLGKWMLPTVLDYMNRLRFSELSSRLAKLSWEERGDVLDKLYPAS